MRAIPFATELECREFAEEMRSKLPLEGWELTVCKKFVDDYQGWEFWLTKDNFLVGIDDYTTYYCSIRLDPRKVGGHGDSYATGKTPAIAMKKCIRLQKKWAQQHIDEFTKFMQVLTLYGFVIDNRIIGLTNKGDADARD